MHVPLPLSVSASTALFGGGGLLASFWLPLLTTFSGNFSVYHLSSSSSLCMCFLSFLSQVKEDPTFLFEDSSVGFPQKGSFLTRNLYTSSVYTSAPGLESLLLIFVSLPTSLPFSTWRRSYLAMTTISLYRHKRAWRGNRHKYIHST